MSSSPFITGNYFVIFILGTTSNFALFLFFSGLREFFGKKKQQILGNTIIYHPFQTNSIKCRLSFMIKTDNLFFFYIFN